MTTSTSATSVLLWSSYLLHPAGECLPIQPSCCEGPYLQRYLSPAGECPPSYACSGSARECLPIQLCCCEGHHPCYLSLAGEHLLAVVFLTSCQPSLSTLVLLKSA